MIIIHLTCTFITVIPISHVRLLLFTSGLVPESSCKVAQTGKSRPDRSPVQSIPAEWWPGAIVSLCRHIINAKSIQPFGLQYAETVRSSQFGCISVSAFIGSRCSGRSRPTTSLFTSISQVIFMQNLISRSYRFVLLDRLMMIWLLSIINISNGPRILRVFI